MLSHLHPAGIKITTVVDESEVLTAPIVTAAILTYVCLLMQW
jgi:hypothetical protein